MLTYRAVWVGVTAGSALLTACASGVCPVVVGGLVLMVSVLFITSLACSDERTLFERIVVLLCILFRMDSRPYIGPPKMTEGHQVNPVRAATRHTALPIAGKEEKPDRAYPGDAEPPRDAVSGRTRYALDAKEHLAPASHGRSDRGGREPREKAQ